MNEINYPYHLIIPSIISIFSLIIFFYKRKKLFKNEKWKWFWVSLTVFFFLYLFIVAGATYSDIYAQWNLNKFDLNKDGFFSGKEITPEQKKAMKNLTSDTGRNLSFISGLIVSGIIALFTLIIGKVIEYLKLSKINKKALN